MRLGKKPTEVWRQVNLSGVRFGNVETFELNVSKVKEGRRTRKSVDIRAVIFWDPLSHT